MGSLNASSGITICSHWGMGPDFLYMVSLILMFSYLHYYSLPFTVISYHSDMLEMGMINENVHVTAVFLVHLFIYIHGLSPVEQN